MRGLLWRGRRCQQAVSWKSWDARTIVRSHGPRAHSRLRPSSWYIFGVLSAEVGTPMLRNEETFQPVCLDVRVRVTEYHLMGGDVQLRPICLLQLGRFRDGCPLSIESVC